MSTMQKLRNSITGMGSGSKTMIILIIILLAVIIATSSQVFESNKVGYYQVKQAALSGDISVRNRPGLYLQLFGEIFTYHISDIHYFSKRPEEGGTGYDADPIQVRFNDGGTAHVSGSLKFRLSQTEKDQINLHRDFKSYKAVKKDLILQTIVEAMMQTATLMKAEEIYSSRRAEFTALVEEQVRKGIYETLLEEKEVMDAEGNKFVKRTVKIKYGEDGKPIIRKKSPFELYSITILQFVIKEIDFDKTIDALIAKKKEAEQQKIVAKAKAEKAKQDAITAKQQGLAEIAKAKAEQEVQKQKAVTEAEKKRDVALLEAEQAAAEAKAKIARGEAEAQVARLKVIAGLSPLEKAKIEKETAIGVAAELAKMKFPEMMILGGDSSGAVNPFTAIGLESLINLQRKIKAETKQ